MNRTTITLVLTSALILSGTAAFASFDDSKQGPPPAGKDGGGPPQGAQGDKGDKANKGQDRQGGRKQGMGGGSPQREAMAMGRALKELEATFTPDQKAKIDGMRTAFEAEAKAFRELNETKMRDLMEQARAAKDSGGDETAIKAEIEKIQAGRPDGKAFAEKIRAELTPEQQKTMDDKMAAMRKEKGGQGKGGQGKGGQGKGGQGKGGPDGQGRPGKGGPDGAPPKGAPDAPAFND